MGETVLPVRFLKEKNKEEISDELIRFEDVGHRYWVYNTFLKEWVTNKDGCGTAPLISATSILNTYFPSTDFSRMAINIWNNTENRIKMETDSTYKYFGCKSIEDILAKWANGASEGTKMHNIFEDLANLIEYGREHPTAQDVLSLYLCGDKLQGYQEIRYFFKAMELLKVDGIKRRVYRTEFLMANPTLSISGMADGLLYDVEDDSYIIIDHKRVKGGLKGDPKNGKPIDKLSPSGRGQILPSFERLRKNSMNIYGCQLTLYKHLFEGMFPGRRVSGMYLIVVDSTKIGDDKALTIHEVPLNKYDENIAEVFHKRAFDILSDYSHSLPTALAKELLRYTPRRDDGDDDTDGLPSIFSDDENEEPPSKRPCP